MNGKLLRGLVGMIVALAAMILLAPVAASAHEMHHEWHSATTGTHLHAGLLPAAQDVDRPDSIAEHGSRKSQALSVARSIDIDSSDDEAGCTAGCCLSMGCCGAALAIEVPVLNPDLRISSAARSESLHPASTGQNALLEPPNHLA